MPPAKTSKQPTGFTIDGKAPTLAGIERIAIADLIPYANNSRTHSDAQVAKIAASLKEFGWTNPVLVSGDNGIIAGHGRVLAARKLGLHDVPVIRLAHLTPAQIKAYVIADNRLALDAGWDDDMLAVELEALQSAGFNMALTGFEKDEIAELLADDTAGLTEDDAVPEAPPQPVSAVGDVWVMGVHRLVCGDSTSRAVVVDKCFAGLSPCIMVTDPPYGVEYDPSWRNEALGGAKTKRTGKVLNDDKADWREVWALFPGDVAYIWHGGLHAHTVFESLASVDFKVRSQIIWVKPSIVLGRGDYHWRHEPAFYATREDAGEPINESAEQDEMARIPALSNLFTEDHANAAYAVRNGKPGRYDGGRKQSTIWEITLKNQDAETVHGTQKPVECMARPIRNNSKRGDAVFEPFSGSGSTLIACQKEGRIFRGVELNPPYVDVAVTRWQNFTGKQAVNEATGLTFDETKAKMLGGSV